MQNFYRTADIVLLKKCYLFVIILSGLLQVLGLALTYDTWYPTAAHHGDVWLIWYVIACTCYLVLIMLILLISINKEQRIHLWHIVTKLLMLIGLGLISVVVGILIEDHYTRKNFYTVLHLAANLFEQFGVGWI